MLLTYAGSKGYVRHNVLATFLMSAGSPTDYKPLTREQLTPVEMAYLPPVLRHLNQGNSKQKVQIIARQ